MNSAIVTVSSPTCLVSEPPSAVRLDASAIPRADRSIWSLTFKTLIAWGIVAFVINFFGDSLNGSFPGAYFMAGMGSQIFFAILVFWFASRQNSIDEEFDLQEK